VGPVTAIAYLAGLCVTLAAVLALAQRRLYVWEDPRIDSVVDMLPGANCGACGVPGCRAFAEKVVDGEFQPGLCPVGGADTAAAVAAFLGVDAGSTERMVARLLCAGGSDVADQFGTYEGYSSCRAATTIAGGAKGCTYGCLGLSDCEVSCTFDAIRMADNGLPVVDFEACTGCGDCVTACPKDLFEMIPVRRKLIVQCKSLLEGDTALEVCRVACTGCGICVSDAPEELMHMEFSLPVIDPGRSDLETPIATYRCPTDAIVWIDDQQFPVLHESTFGSDVVDSTTVVP
jgi:H+/Na+-translocating ferredoxin:NAD+ oxidoreductase subunit B